MNRFASFLGVNDDSDLIVHDDVHDESDLQAYNLYLTFLNNKKEYKKFKREFNDKDNNNKEAFEKANYMYKSVISLGNEMIRHQTNENTAKGKSKN